MFIYYTLCFACLLYVFGKGLIHLRRLVNLDAIAHTQKSDVITQHLSQSRNPGKAVAIAQCAAVVHIVKACHNRAAPGKAVAIAQRATIAHIVKTVAIAQHLEKLSQSRSVSQSRTPREPARSHGSLRWPCRVTSSTNSLRASWSVAGSSVTVV